MKTLFLLTFFLFNLLAHDLSHTISHAKSVAVSFSFATNEDFAYQSYEIYAPGNEQIPFSVGRTDALSRAVFIPNQKGEWLLKVFSEEGHGKIVKLDIDEDMRLTTQMQIPKWLKIYSGLITIFLLFALLFIYKQSKQQ
ncbi:MAG: hypothetical protein IE916_02750 [Epsilonproteobacteria bacterium]|nr:hypothetical protein [Campylobacterota bacterium]